MKRQLKYRKHDWLDTTTNRPRYGIQAKEKGVNGWMNLARAGKPMIYNTEEERDSNLKALRKQVPTAEVSELRD